jgi:lipopolysaccharide biosynthesis glycosyltransferase
MNSKICCFTSANYAYLSRARLLAATFKEHNCGVDVILMLNDVKPEYYEMDMAQEPFDYVIQIDQIGIPDFINWSFKHNVVELCTAVKGSCAKYLLTMYDKVIYLDPDIAVFDSLQIIIDQLDHSDIVLTPHQLTPCVDSEQLIQDIELCSLKHGVFNLGFFAVANREQGKQFINWWESRLLRYCYEDIPSGIFTDQKWCNIAPAYFSHLYILRDYGCNVASWNLYERILEFRENRVFVNNNDSLKFYHFTKYGSAGDIMTERYARSKVTFEIWYWYGRKLKEFNFNYPPIGYYYYGFYNNGVKINDEDRRTYRTHYCIGLPNPY